MEPHGFSSFTAVKVSTTVTCCQKPSSLNNEDVLEDLLMQRIWGCSWNKLVRRECFVKWNISFHPEMNLWEDIYVICKLLICGAKVAYVPKVLYFYDSKSNPNSIVMHRKYEHVRSVMIFVDDISSLLTQPRYNEGWYNVKKKVKRWLFNLNASQEDMSQIYKEVNTKIIQEGKTSSFCSLPYCLALAVAGHTKLAHTLYKVGSIICNCLKR